MNSPVRRIMEKSIVGATALWVTAATAIAQSDIVRPPKTEEPEGVSTILVMGIGVVCLAAVVGVNVIPSRRTHQD